VRDPARAVAEPCWTVPDATAADLTLGELLTERLDAQTASEVWQVEQDTMVRRRRANDTLGEVLSFGALADWLGSEKAARAMKVIVADPAALLDNEPEFADRMVGWLTQRRRINRFDARQAAQPLVSVLEHQRRRSRMEEPRSAHPAAHQT
jgi:hypothetical protein